MNIKKTYTKTIHAALKNALKTNNRVEYNFEGTGLGEYIRYIYNTNKGIIIKLNTAIMMHCGIDKNYFLSLSYEDVISQLEENSKNREGYKKLLPEYRQIRF